MKNRLPLFIPFLSLIIPVLLFILLVILVPNIDVYLLIGLSFNIFITLFILLIPIMFIMLIYNKGKRISSIKSLYKRYTIFLSIILSIFIIIEGIIIYRGYSYTLDIIYGPHEALIKDAIIKKESSYRSSYSYYISGNIENKKIKYIINSDSNIIKGKHTVKIYYYKYIKEVYKIEYK